MQKKLLVILGPTSTGKTDLALSLAKKFNGELISADSRQVYKYLDIGTGKMPGSVSSVKGQVSREKEHWTVNGINIYMYDVADPGKRYNLYQYINDSQKVIKKIIRQRKVPILVGGTGLYIRGLVDGVSNFEVGENEKLRSELENLEMGDIKKRIETRDPNVLKTLNNSDLNNKRRLIRILEKLQSKNAHKSFSGLDKDFYVLKVGLCSEIEFLRKRIKERVIKRLEEGMIKESKQLLRKKVLSFKRMEELGLEYKYIAKFLKGEIKSLDELIDKLHLKIGQYAKRQITWFKKEKGVVWFDITDPNYLKDVESLVSNWYNISNE